eukprot:scaffold130422_cov50-Prasinocladus_malaysianus.AAC.1
MDEFPAGYKWQHTVLQARATSKYAIDDCEAQQWVGTCSCWMRASLAVSASVNAASLALAGCALCPIASEADAEVISPAAMPRAAKYTHSSANNAQYFFPLYSSITRSNNHKEFNMSSHAPCELVGVISCGDAFGVG